MDERVTSMGELIDRLIVEDHKLGHFERAKAAEQKKENPDANLIVRWDKASRTANEKRSIIKGAIDKMFAKAIKEGKYSPIEEMRTFD